MDVERLAKFWPPDTLLYNKALPYSEALNERSTRLGRALAKGLMPIVREKRGATHWKVERESRKPIQSGTSQLFTA